MTRVLYAGDEAVSTAGSAARLAGPLRICRSTWRRISRPVTLRWVLIHVLEDTARHAGHADIVRELIDGSTGDHRRSGPGEAIPAWPGS